MSVTHEVLDKTGTTRITLTPLRAIKHKCLDCSNFNRAEVRACPIIACALYPFRLGHMAHGRGLSEETRKKAIDRLKRYRFSAGHAQNNKETKQKISTQGLALEKSMSAEG